jgi:hypothetical protein
MRRAIAIAFAIEAAATGGSALAEPAPPGNPVSDLRAQLSHAPSATAVLDRWCASHLLAPPGAVIADKIAEGVRPGSPALRHVLRVGPGEPLRFRHVRLRCGNHILSQALLWYVPGRLPDAINRRLEETDIAFGRAVAPLAFRRRAVASRGPWPRERGAGAPGARRAILFEQSALLVLPDGTPIAHVREAYLRGVLDFQSD